VFASTKTSVLLSLSAKENTVTVYTGGDWRQRLPLFAHSSHPIHARYRLYNAEYGVTGCLTHAGRLSK